MFFLGDVCIVTDLEGVFLNSTVRLCKNYFYSCIKYNGFSCKKRNFNMQLHLMSIETKNRKESTEKRSNQPLGCFKSCDSYFAYAYHLVKIYHDNPPAPLQPKICTLHF